MRIRLIALPRPGDLDEFDLRRLRVGEVYDLPPRMATILLISRYAELESSVDQRDTAADNGRPKTSKPDPEF